MTGYFGRIAKWHEHCGAPKDVGHCRRVRGDDRCAAGHGFEGREAKAFVERREDERDCASQQRSQVGVGNVAEEPYVIAETEATNFAFE